MQRWVLHIDMDAFFASCEQLTRPTLRGRPVLVGGVSGRGVVAGASYEARLLGAKSAMPMFQARPLIGFRGVVVAPRGSVYRAASHRVFEIFETLGGIVEKVSVDEGFLEPEEIQGAEPEVVQRYAENLRALVREQTGLAASVGAGPGKQYAKIGSGLAKPDGVFIIPEAQREQLLNPLPVGTLWGVGPVTRKKLEQMGIHTIGDLAAMSEKAVDISLGSTVGRSLWSMARGIDNRPVAPRAIAKQVSAEHTYPQDLRTVAEVDLAIKRAATDAHRRLEKDGRGARTITLKLRMADFHIESRSLTLDHPTDDLETLSAASVKLARYPQELGPIRLVGVSYSGLEEARQDVLFPELDKHWVERKEEPDLSDYEVGVRANDQDRIEGTEVLGTEADISAEKSAREFKATQDVYHPQFGHGWIQGLGHGLITVRFETRTTTQSCVKNFAIDDCDLQPADPLASLEWDDYLHREG